MKIAFVAPPEAEDMPPLPPLPLAYLAALLEQKRHIVRIYDLALNSSLPLAEALAPLCAFRPHIIAVASTKLQAAAAIHAALSGSEATIVNLDMDARTFAVTHVQVEATYHIDEHTICQDEQNVILSGLNTLNDELDALPFPARHLLSLEEYPLRTPTGELQTTVLVGKPYGGAILLRNAKYLVAELRSIAREHGIRHVRLLGATLTDDLAWLQQLLYDLEAADLGIAWEGRIYYQDLTTDLLTRLQGAGCEVLGLEFNAGEVLDARDKRTTISAIVDQAHELDMLVRGHIELEPPYDAIAALVDLSATFNLDDVRFSIPRRDTTHEHTADQVRPALAHVTEMAWSRYQSRRSRQFFIERFGPQIGPMLWRVGRSGLLGRTWQRYADGGMVDPASI